VTTDYQSKLTNGSWKDFLQELGEHSRQRSSVTNVLGKMTLSWEDVAAAELMTGRDAVSVWTNAGSG